MQRQRAQQPDNVTRSESRLSGFTLVELLIVCGLLAAIAAMSWPTVQGSLAKSRLKKAASDLRTTFGRTRNDAIRKGQSFAVRYELNGRRYLIERSSGHHPDQANGFNAQADISNADSSFTSDQASEEDSEFEPIEKELPEGVRFTSIDDETDDDFEETLTGADLSIPEDEAILSDTEEATEWSEPIVFHANGRTDNAKLKIINQRGFFIDLTLRGLTGIVTSTPPARVLKHDENDGLLRDEANQFPSPTEVLQP